MRPLFVLAVLVALSGCNAALRTVPLADPARANHQLAGRAVTVVLATGEAVPAQAVRVAPDSTSWFDPATGALVSVPTASVAEVQHRDRRRTRLRAVRRGGIAGAVAGGLLGAVFGYNAGDWIEGTQAQDTVIAGLVAAVWGAGYGAGGGVVVGSLSSPTDRYVIRPAPSPPADTTASEARAGVRPAPGPPLAR